MPTSSTVLAPTMSAIDPAMRRAAPDVRPYTDEGHRYSERSKDIDRAMTGNPTVMIPFVKLAQKPTKDGVKIVRNVFSLDALRSGRPEEISEFELLLLLGASEEVLD
jgi:hypothetical protein